MLHRFLITIDQGPGSLSPRVYDGEYLRRCLAIAGSCLTTSPTILRLEVAVHVKTGNDPQKRAGKEGAYASSYDRKPEEGLRD